MAQGLPVQGSDSGQAASTAADAALALIQQDLVFIDCEMTGGDPDRNDIIEIGAARSRLPDLALLDQLSVKVAPRTTRGHNQSSLRIAGYSPKEWKSAIPIDEALQRLRDFSRGCATVGWAAYNDLLFVRAAAERAAIDDLVQEAYVELQDWARDRLHFRATPGLQRVADQLKIVRDQEHSAIEDALVSYEVFRMLWRFSTAELDAALPGLDWNSYVEMAGPIVIEDAAARERRAELARYVVAGTSREALLARRKSYHRD